MSATSTFGPQEPSFGRALKGQRAVRVVSGQRGKNKTVLHYSLQPNIEICVFAKLQDLRAGKPIYINSPL